MLVADEQGLFCVELDGASPTSTYYEYVKSIQDGTVLQNLQQFDMINTMYTQSSFSDKYGIAGACEYLDEMLS